MKKIEKNKVKSYRQKMISAIVAEVYGKVESAEDFTVDDFNKGKVTMKMKLQDTEML